MMDKHKLQSWCDDYNALPSSLRDSKCASCEYYRPVFNACQIHAEVNPVKNGCGQYLHIVGQTRTITKQDRVDLLALHLEHEAEKIYNEQQKKNKQLKLF